MNNKIDRNWFFPMDTKEDLVRALTLTDILGGSGCSIFDDSVFDETLDLLPKNISTLAHDAVNVNNRLREYEHNLTNDLTSAEFIEMTKERDDKAEKLKEPLMSLTEDQLWKFIGFLLEDIEC